MFSSRCLLSRCGHGRKIMPWPTCAHGLPWLLRLLLLATVVPAGEYILRPAVSVRARRLKFVGVPSPPSPRLTLSRSWAFPNTRTLPMGTTNQGLFFTPGHVPRSFALCRTLRWSVGAEESGGSPRKLARPPAARLVGGGRCDSSPRPLDARGRSSHAGGGSSSSSSGGGRAARWRGG